MYMAYLRHYLFVLDKLSCLCVVRRAIFSLPAFSEEIALKKRIVVIGAGPGGIEAALSAAPYAQSVALISAGPVADWGQLLSSRIWLQTLERQMNSADAPIEFDLR